MKTFNHKIFNVTTGVKNFNTFKEPEKIKYTFLRTVKDNLKVFLEV